MASVCKAVAAIDGLVGLGFERNFGGSAAFCADCVVHYAAGLAAGCGLAVPSARFAASGCVVKTLFCIEFLFTCGESEFLAAILANQYFVFKHLV